MSVTEVAVVSAAFDRIVLSDTGVVEVLLEDLANTHGDTGLCTSKTQQPGSTAIKKINNTILRILSSQGRQIIARKPPQVNRKAGCRPRKKEAAGTAQFQRLLETRPAKEEPHFLQNRQGDGDKMIASAK